MDVHYFYNDGQWHETPLSMLRKSPCELMAERIDEALSKVEWSPIAEFAADATAGRGG